MRVLPIPDPVLSSVDTDVNKSMFLPHGIYFFLINPHIRLHSSLLFRESEREIGRGGEREKNNNIYVRETH